MKPQLLALAIAVALGALMASTSPAQAIRPLITEIVDVTHVTKKSAALKGGTRVTWRAGRAAVARCRRVR